MDIQKDTKRLGNARGGLAGNGNNAIPTNSLFDDFRDHVEASGNNRILFSGKFGTGKTSFIVAFFQRHEKEYFLVRLCPAAYQIVGSEMITEVIKKDLLVSVMEQGQRNKLVKHYRAVREQILEHDGATEDRWKLATLLGRLDPVAGFIVDALRSMTEAFGTVTEQEIKKVMTLVAEEKKKVLVIDDLDRLDPEHIFRLFNVFSLFVGEDEEKTIATRLGFDRVIFVADYRNLTSLFHHKYGAGTDSQGYLDKFYSREIFEYDPKEIITAYIGEVFDTQNKQVADRSGQHISTWLSLFLLKNFLRKNALDLRQILNGLETLQYSQKRNRSEFHAFKEQEDRDIIRRTVAFLIKTVGSKRELIRVIEQSLPGDSEPIVDDRYGQDDLPNGLRHHFKCVISAINLSPRAPALVRLLKDTPIKGLVLHERDSVEETIDAVQDEVILESFKKLLILYIEEFH